jgi:hypothetical protein
MNNGDKKNHIPLDETCVNCYTIRPLGEPDLTTWSFLCDRNRSSNLVFPGGIFNRFCWPRGHILGLYFVLFGHFLYRWSESLFKFFAQENQSYAIFLFSQWISLN